MTKTLTNQFREEGLQLLVLDNLEEKAEQYYEKFGGCLEGSAV